MTSTSLDLLALPAADTTETFVRREDEFRLLYDRTSRGLWVYLHRLTRDAHQADDLLQETYYRFLRTPGVYESDLHERNALYRIATNLARDGHRRARSMVSLDGPAGVDLQQSEGPPAHGDRTDVQRAIARMRVRDQQLLWLAYAEGSSHDEIAASLGLRPSSVRTLLFRARRRLAALLSPRPCGGAR